MSPSADKRYQYSLDRFIFTPTPACRLPRTLTDEDLCCTAAAFYVRGGRGPLLPLIRVCLPDQLPRRSPLKRPNGKVKRGCEPVSPRKGGWKLTLSGYSRSSSSDETDACTRAGTKQDRPPFPPPEAENRSLSFEPKYQLSSNTQPSSSHPIQHPTPPCFCFSSRPPDPLPVVAPVCA